MFQILISVLMLFVSNLYADSSLTGGTSGGALIKSKFNLTNQNGESVSEKDYHGKYMMVFFGFSNCSTICPTGLSIMVEAVNKFKDFDVEIVPIFITVDPERDTVERLANYVKLYDPKLIGLTGEPEQIAEATKSFRAYYGKSDVDKEGNYSFDHSPIIYLIGKEGQYLTHFSSDLGIEIIVDQVKSFVK